MLLRCLMGILAQLPPAPFLSYNLEELPIWTTSPMVYYWFHCNSIKYVNGDTVQVSRPQIGSLRCTFANAEIII